MIDLFYQIASNKYFWILLFRLPTEDPAFAFVAFIILSLTLYVYYATGIRNQNKRKTQIVGELSVILCLYILVMYPIVTNNKNYINLTRNNPNTHSPIFESGIKLYSEETKVIRKIMYDKHYFHRNAFITCRDDGKSKPTQYTIHHNINEFINDLPQKKHFIFGVTDPVATPTLQHMGPPLPWEKGSWSQKTSPTTAQLIIRCIPPSKDARAVYNVTYSVIVASEQ